MSDEIVNPMLEDYDEESDELDDGLPDLFVDSLNPGGDYDENLPDSFGDSNEYYDIDYGEYEKLDEYRKDVPVYDHDDFSSVDESVVMSSVDDESNGSLGDLVTDDDKSVSDDSLEDEDDVLRSGVSGLEELLNLSDTVPDPVAEVDDVRQSGAFYRDDDDDDENVFKLPLDKILTKAIDMGASDVDILSNDEVSFTILGDTVRIPEFGVVTSRHVMNLYLDITSHMNQDDFLQELELDTSYEIRSGKYTGRRLRLNVAKSFDNHSLVFRVISDRIPSMEELGLDPRLLEWSTLPNGLILLNGKTGTGKSTTLASIIRQIQLTRYDKIVTVEKPVEYVYGVAGKGVVVQREVGRDTLSFSNALDSAMRQHPDVILIGEVRNQVEVNALLYAAETGHLAFSTMHTNSAAATLSRIKRLYKGSEQTMVLGDLSEVSRGFASQVLVKSPDGDSRFAVAEILQIDDTVKKLILEGDTEGIIQYQIESESTLEHELAKAVVAGKCTREEAMKVSFVRPRLENILENYG